MSISSPSKFDITVFQRQLTTKWLGRSICYFEELESTNTYLKKCPSVEIEQGMICLTDNQTHGRGQYQRKWESTEGENITFSLAFVIPQVDRFHVLTLSCALAIVNHLNTFLENSAAHISWPNDVILNGRKVAGLLAESVFSGNKLDRLIIGIGVNVNQDVFSEDIRGKATSVRLEMGKPVNREIFLSRLLSRIEYNYNLWHRKQPELLKSINRNIEGYGRWIGMVVDGERRDEKYKLLGINESGELLMLHDDGEIESFSYEQIRLVTD